MEIKLGELEAGVLYAILRCADDAYGVSVFDDLKTHGYGDVAMGTIYATLDRLECKELVKSWWSEPGPGRGGRRKRMFEVTGAGKAKLRDYDARFMSIRDGWQLA